MSEKSLKKKGPVLDHWHNIGLCWFNVSTSQDTYLHSESSASSLSALWQFATGMAAGLQGIFSLILPFIILKNMILIFCLMLLAFPFPSFSF